LRKVENDDIDARNVRSIKNSKSLLEFPTITMLHLLLSTQKRSMRRMVEIALVGWREQDI